jgi:bifunctional DNase/RNase
MLEESEGARQLPIWIGIAEARSIAAQMEKVDPPRPNTHDLAKRLIEGLDARVERVVVTELRSGIYYARIVLSVGGRRVEIDSRPSDAIAIALRVDAPLFANEELLELAEDEENTPTGGEGQRIRFEAPATPATPGALRPAFRRNARPGASARAASTRTVSASTC